ncbi:MAG: VCBS repeat-containing protein [Myxococcales bacterium]|nr:MAG: VCBS repeat-containing protein [Myxococcales bacterium]
MRLTFLHFVLAFFLFACGSSNHALTEDAGVDGEIDAAALLSDGGKEGETLPDWEEGACRLEPAAEPFANPSTELHWDASALPFPEFKHAIMSPVVVDFVPEAEGDAIPEIVFISYQNYPETGVLRVVSGRSPYTNLLTFAGDGSAPIVAPSTDTTGKTPALRFDGHVAAGDLNGDGYPEIVATKQNGGVVAFTRNSDGSFSELWSKNGSDWPGVSSATGETQPNGSPAIANLDGTGSPEVIIGRLVLNGNDGSLRWIGTGGAKGINSQGPLSCVADLDEDGSMEVIAGATVFDKDGNIVWQNKDGSNNPEEGFCAIADVVSNSDGSAGQDGLPEVIRVSKGKVYFHETRINGNEGNVVWSIEIPKCDTENNITCTSNCASKNSGGAPTVADFDGDGKAEVGVAGGSCYVVFDPDCKGANVEGCVEDGIRWVHSTEDDSSNVTSSTVFDFNGDGSAEVVYNDEQRFLVFDGKTGAEVFSDWNPSRTRTEQPIVADVDNDGNAEIVFVSNTEANFAGDGIPGNVSAEERIPGVEIWSSADDSWVRARPLWNQHTYHISNVNDDMTIPTEEIASWKTHNTYRLNAAVGDSLAAPDLGTDAGAVVCEDFTMKLCIQLYNSGDVEVGAGIEVEFHRDSADGELLASTASSRNIPPGEYGEVVCGEWDPASSEVGPVDIVALIDPGAKERECVEDNNSLSFSVIPCSFDSVF